MIKKYRISGKLAAFWTTFIVLSVVFVFPVFSQSPLPSISEPSPTPSSSPTPTVTSTPTPTPYTNPAGKQPPGQQKKIQQISERSALLISKIQNTLSRIDAIWVRIQSRITAFGAQGKDITPLAGALPQVAANRQAIVDAIALAQANLAQMPTANNPKRTGQALVSELRSVKTAMKIYHQSIVNVIKNIKGMSGNTGVFPTQTPTPTPVPSVTPTVTATPTPTMTI